MAASGITASTVSTRPRFSGTVTSVTHALNAASLAVEPKNVITQSSITTSTAVAWAACTAATSQLMTGTRTSPNAAMLTPHSR